MCVCQVKSGGGIEALGVRFEVRVDGKQDFSRDVLKVSAHRTLPVAHHCSEYSITSVFNRYIFNQICVHSYYFSIS